MKQNRKNMYTIKQRLSFLLVLFFCLLTSVLEYLPQNQTVDTPVDYSQTESDATNDHKFVAVTVDAVVPFVVAISQHVFHVIFEFVYAEKSKISTIVSTTAQNFHFWEILLEQIISTNAP
ncbi:hypothetical protein [Mongoliitalea daihaiensis]|uniref:hypothetical protein n=1 Tax=Mongoliitalea daihaiensis TaxID=2782006 RepID=UPI001F3D27D5|nr:hypothetical protein [Mongoliitalea daihaiensis]UJP66247.1 hypothetical protein IPZ59_06405 [Mongoliitalea daihaiensis]